MLQVSESQELTDTFFSSLFLRMYAYSIQILPILPLFSSFFECQRTVSKELNSVDLISVGSGHIIGDVKTVRVMIGSKRCRICTNNLYLKIQRPQSIYCHQFLV